MLKAEATVECDMLHSPIYDATQHSNVCNGKIIYDYFEFPRLMMTLATQKVCLTGSEVNAKN